MTRPVTALTVAGSDPSGGAGIQADLKTFGALGAYGTAVLTALTAQSTRGVTGVHVVPPDFVREQLTTLLDDVVIDAVKIGMLATAAVADVVAEVLLEQRCPIVVLDPVMVATSGDRLLDDDGVDAVRRMLPIASVVTPNLPEAAVLLGADPAGSLEEMREQAAALRSLGVQHVLLKGGHRRAAPEAVDLFVGPEGEQVLTSPWVRTENTHGTGCALSSALAALRPQRKDWAAAAASAKEWLSAAVRAGAQLEIGHGHGPIEHFHAR